MPRTSSIFTSKRTNRIAEQRLELRNQLWAGIPESQLWNRKKENGFATVPRTLPLIMLIMDSLTKNTPVSSTYLDLWCRMYDEGFVRLDKPHEMALASGFTTNRGIQIWSSRLDLLQKLDFILLAPGPQGNRSFALIINPYFVVQNKRTEIEERLYNTLVGQALAIGAVGLGGATPTVTPPTTPATRPAAPSPPPAPEAGSPSKSDFPSEGIRVA